MDLRLCQIKLNVTFAPAGSISATNVQAAIESLDSSKQNSLGYTPINKAGDTGVGPLTINRLQVCWHVSASLAVAVGNVPITWTFPIAFIKTTDLTTNAKTFGANSHYYSIGIESLAVSSLGGYIFNIWTGTVNVVLHLIAVGAWK